jgi:hypothetical protein
MTVLEPCSEFPNNATTCKHSFHLPNWSKHREKGRIVEPHIFEVEATSCGDGGVYGDEERSMIRGGMGERGEGGVRRNDI